MLFKWKWIFLVAIVAVPGALKLAMADYESIDDIIPQEEMQDEAGVLDESAQTLGRELMIRVNSEEGLRKHAQKRVQIIVHKSMKELGHQYMSVQVDGKEEYRFVVSTAWERKVTGKSGRRYSASTPEGKFLLDKMQPKRWSNLWRVNLLYVLLFTGHYEGKSFVEGGVWIHATTPDHFKELGAPASGGCVRMHPEDAETLYKLISSYGMQETAITILPAPGEQQIPRTPANVPIRQ